jgi:hypothetical protein
MVTAAANRVEAQDRVTSLPLFSISESETELTCDNASNSVNGLFIAEALPLLPGSLPVLTPPQDPAQKPPEPQHTGFAALIRTIGADFKAFPRRRSTYVILAIGGAAAGLAHPADEDVNGRLQGSKGVGRLFAPGKYVGHGGVQAGAAAGTYLLGRYVIKPGGQKTNKISHIGYDLVRANILTQALTYGVKIAVRRDRPTGECCSFPSGHAAVTFATASVLERHFGYRAAWPTFAIAGYVAASRLHDDRHFLSDVLFGSALGIASGWTVVGRHGRGDYTLMPVPTRGGVAVVFLWTPWRSPKVAR